MNTRHSPGHLEILLTDRPPRDDHPNAIQREHPKGKRFISVTKAAKVQNHRQSACTVTAKARYAETGKTATARKEMPVAQNMDPRTRKNEVIFHREPEHRYPRHISQPKAREKVTAKANRKKRAPSDTEQRSVRREQVRSLRKDRTIARHRN